MKKLTMLLALIVALLLAVPALAEGRTVPMPASKNGWKDSVQSLCYAGDTLYVLGNSGLYRLTPGADALETVVDLTEASRYMWRTDRPEDEREAALWSQAVQWIAAEGETLIAVQPWSGQVLTLNGDALSVAFDLPAGLLAMADDEDMRREVLGAACQGGELFLLLGTDSWDDWEKTELFAVDLSTQAVRACSAKGLRAIAAGAPGELLVTGVRPDDWSEESVLLRYDIAADSAGEELARFDGGTDAGGAVWNAALGEPVLLVNSRVVRAGAPDVALAYAPAQFATYRLQAACSASGSYAVAPSGDTLFLSDVSTGEAARMTELRVAGYADSRVLTAFCAENPDIAVVPVAFGEGARSAVISGSPVIDLLELSAPGDFASYASHGYLAELDSEALRAWMATLYPAIGEAVARDGKLLGVPVGLYPSTWTIDETMWQAVGMGEEPKTYADVFDAMARYGENHAADYPDYVLSDLQAMGLSSAVGVIVREYVLEREAAGEALTFDTPAFREAMRLVIENAHLLEEGGDGMAILSDYNQGFGISYNDDHRVRMMFSPALTSGERTMNVSLNVYAVSAASEHKQEATRFLEWYAAHLGDLTLYQMTPSLMEPVERENYAARIAELEGQLAALEERLLKAQDADDAQALEEEITGVRRMIESNEQSRYSISAESIAIYREMARNLRVPWDSLLAVSGAEESLMDVIAPICGDGFTAGEVDALIAQLDRVASMAAQESM